MKIVVASQNPVKVSACETAFRHYLRPKEESLDVSTVDVDSGVSEQPIGLEIIKTGAINRVKNAQEADPDSDYWIGIEGGVDWRNEDLVEFSITAILNRENIMSTARTGEFKLPPKIAKLIRSGETLGSAADKVFSTKNSKQKEGAVGFLTKSAVTRESYLRQSVIFAAIPFFNPQLY
jgi:inosine/xanthosine triphosphatase